MCSNGTIVLTVVVDARLGGLRGSVAMQRNIRTLFGDSFRTVYGNITTNKNRMRAFRERKGKKRKALAQESVLYMH